MDNIIKPLLNLEAYESMVYDIKKNQTPIYLTGIVDSAKSHMIHGLVSEGQKLIVTYNELRAKELVEDLRFYEKDKVYNYPSRDMIFYSADVHSNDLLRERLDVIGQLIRGNDVTVVMSIEALLDSIIMKQIFEKHVKNLDMDSVVKADDFYKELSYMGYERVVQVEGRGQFAVRGGIIDIYPINSDEIYRIELWGDEIDSMRLVNPETQRSMYTVEQLTIMPAREMVVDDQRINDAKESMNAEYNKLRGQFKKASKDEHIERLDHAIGGILDKVTENGNFNGIEGLVYYYYQTSEIGSIIDYFTKPFIFLDEPARLKQRIENTKKEFDESIKNRLEKGYVLPSQMKVFHKPERILKGFEINKTVLLSTLHQNEHLIPYKSTHDVLTKSVNAYHQNFDMWIKDMQFFLDKEYEILFLTGSRTRAKRLVEELREHELSAFYVENQNVVLKAGSVGVAYGSLHKGFDYPQLKLIVFTETEVMGQKKKKKKRRKFKEGRKIDSFTELKVGDYVVHENYGVGVFSGIEQIEVDSITKDFIKISYKDSGNLYITTSQLDMIQKYIGAEGKAPKLNKLNGTEWKKAKSRVKAAVEDLADELIELYAKRQVARGFSYSTDTTWQTEFEELFPYDETDDQLTAITDTKNDMESGRVMDRLICGDVGYGKTEVAIRAAFKAVQDDKQVAYLVPTTILAQQQYNNFQQRMKDFPVKVAMLSRFKTKKEQKVIIENINRGRVDIVIGTHRLFSKDIDFKRLGLLIVDEEQRFGVKHKETLKQLKESIDVLTLTATPIPRTLHMSLIGIRDMSVLEEPPEERHPIQTYVMEYNEELVKDAVYRELARGGQVYYVFNRVKGIDRITDEIQGMVPQANVEFAHGQMSERQLENKMMDFVNGEIDVLVATTIIETGLDIANTNTIIIHDADKMGLSQLYQLRGRVGRSNRIAYAYLMYKKNKILDEIAEKRLQAIKEFTEFGSGFKIAMRDLEIRGAGNLLGTSQSGHMDAVGYDLYCKMLEQAVQSLGDSPIKEKIETVVDFDVDAYIPGRFINDEVLKIESYKKIATIRNRNDFDEMTEELIDRYGDIPRSVDNLLNIALIKGMAMEASIVEIKQKGLNFTLEMSNKAPVDPANIPALIKKYRQALKFTGAAKPYFTYTIKAKEKKETLKRIQTLITDIRTLEGTDAGEN